MLLKEVRRLAGGGGQQGPGFHPEPPGLTARLGRECDAGKEPDVSSSSFPDALLFKVRSPWQAAPKVTCMLNTPVCGNPLPEAAGDLEVPAYPSSPTEILGLALRAPDLLGLLSSSLATLCPPNLSAA